MQRYCLARCRGTVPFGAGVLTRSVQRYCPVRCRGTASLGAGVLSRSVQGYCPARCRGTDPLGSGVAIRSDQRYESAFKQLHISPTFAPQTRIKTRLGFQRAGRATRFEQGEQLASSGASNSLRAGRATRSEQGEQLARVCTANAHKNIGDKIPSPLTSQDSKGQSPLAGREREGGSKGGRGNPALNGVSSPSLKEKIFRRSFT